MKNITTGLLLGIAPLAMFGQNVDADTTVHQLREIVIEAPKVIRKADMDIYHPSKSAVDNAKNGIQLLDNLMIPALSVSEALGTIQAAGQAVQVRINGREASVDQVRALLPETIKRVEWMDNPGLRYGGANYVLNFIVANPTVGGSLQLEARPALNTAWGFYMADAKFNVGRSQWQFGGIYKLTEDMKTHRDYTETFTYPDGASLTRKESSLGGAMDNTFARPWASYSYVKPDTTVFVADFAMQTMVHDKTTYNGLLRLSNGSDLFLTESQGNRGLTPTLSMYLQQNFRNNQMLVLNLMGSFYSGRSFSDYIERPGAYGTVLPPINDIHTNIKDRNQAYAVQADYIKNWKNSRLTAGASYTANRNRSKYITLDGSVFHQRQNKIYMYAEYYHRFGKWSATAGMGVQYTDFLFVESNRGNHSWSPRPQATITYSPNNKHNFRLSFTSWQSTPSLAETNIVPQQLDGFQWRVGNQDIRTANSYMLTLRYGFNLPRVNGIFGVRAFTSPNAITPLLYWEDNRLITSYENSRGLQNLSFFLAPQIEVIPKWLMLSGYLQYRVERMRGTGYDLHSDGWSGNAVVRVTHWGFTLSGTYIRSQRDLWGEKISWSEDMNMIDLSYNMKGWQFRAGMLLPFGKYDRGSKSLSKWNHNEQHMRLNMRIPYIAVSYNLQWGRQKRSANKVTQVQADADRSTTGGR